MRLRQLLVAALLALGFGVPGCTCSNTGGPNHLNGDAGVNFDALMAGITVTPAEVTLDLNAGGPAVTQQYKAVTQSGQDVTTTAVWVLEDPTIGTISSTGLFTSTTSHGGTTNVKAAYNNLYGQAILHVKLHYTVGGSCPTCPQFPNPPPGPPCAAGTAPTLVYPPDGVLLPPNMNVMQVQFLPGTGTMFYEVDFENASTDIRAATLCNPVNDTRGVATGGCSFDLDPATWKLLADSNRGGDAVAVTVRATTDGTCASPSGPRSISFAEEDLNGGLYYWQSLVVGGVAGKTGGIYRYDFGAAGAAGQPFITPATTGTNIRCVGCHFLSRDGTRMTYGSDDADSDDEYGDLHGNLLEVATKMPLGAALPPGFQTFTHDAQILMASTGNQSVTQFGLYNGQTGAGPTGNAQTGMRGTQPDWSADDSSVIFVVPQKFANQFTPAPYGRADDDHFLGGSLFTMSYDVTSKMFGTPKALVQSMGENNYYPSFSPDTPASFVVFNRADDPALTTDLSKDAFNNPYAKVWILSTKSGATPFEATALNGDPQSTNSWPRWSPFVQTYRGQKLLWVTFSSTRDYGIKVRNHTKVNVGGSNIDQVNCYPPDSPQNLTGSHQQPLPGNCNQPQIWMSAINLSTAEFASMDPSYPAFWLPFQDVTAHNHIAQWTQVVQQAPSCTDGGMATTCLGDGEACGPNICGQCCGTGLCSNGICSTVIP